MMNKKQEIAALVIEMQNGNEDAFSRIYTLVDPELRVHARTKFGNISSEALEDQLQEAYFTIIKHINNLRDPGNFRAWAKKILYSRLCDYAQREKEYNAANKFGKEEDAETAFLKLGSFEKSAEQTFIMEEILSTTMAKMTELPEEQATALQAFACDDLSEAEIAAIMQCPVNTVKSRIRLAREKMRRLDNRLVTA